MDETCDPYDAGLGWTVKLHKGRFIGSAALAEARLRGPRRHMVGLRTSDRSIPRHGAGIMRDADQVGVVTSGTYSFFLNQGIAMASMAKGSGAAGETVEVDSRGRRGSAEVVKLPIYRGSVRSPAAAKN